jgi:hypothetical protein
MIFSIFLNEISKFEVDVSNSIYEVNVDTSFKNLNYMTLCIQLDASTLNLDSLKKKIYIYIYLYILTIKCFGNEMQRILFP